MFKYAVVPILLLIGCVSCSDVKPEAGTVMDNTYQQKAIALLEQNQLDSSFYYFDKAKEQYLLAGDSVNAAHSLIDMAINQYEWSDFFGAQETSLEALRYLDPKNKKQHSLLASIYNTIANATDEMDLYAEAIPYYNMAIRYETNDENLRLYKNNLAICLRNTKQYSEAIALLEQLLKDSPKSSVNYSKYLNNLAKVKALKDKDYNPLLAYQEALRLRIQHKDLWGQNSSYATLAAYYKDSDTDSAIYYTKQHYAVAQRINSPTDRLRALKVLIQFGSTYADEYLSRYLALNDSLQTLRTKAKNQFALIRYESQKNKTRNLELENENEKKEVHLLIQYISIAALILLLLAILLWLKKHKQHTRLETEHKINESKLQLSKKIHDTVANGIYRLMTEIEYKGLPNRNNLLDKLDNMYQTSRDISHEVEEDTETTLSYSQQIKDMLVSFASDDCRVLLAGNSDAYWKGFGKSAQEELHHVLQELMVNMDKHSRADRVVVRFTKHDDRREISYKDNGIGLADPKNYGKGMRSTVSRIKSIGGKIIFAKDERQGLRVTISIPI